MKFREFWANLYLNQVFNISDVNGQFKILIKKLDLVNYLKGKNIYQFESSLYKFFYNHYNCFLLSSANVFPIWTGEPIPGNYTFYF